MLRFVRSKPSRQSGGGPAASVAPAAAQWVGAFPRGLPAYAPSVAAIFSSVTHLEFVRGRFARWRSCRYCTGCQAFAARPHPRRLANAGFPFRFSGAGGRAKCERGAVGHCPDNTPGSRQVTSIRASPQIPASCHRLLLPFIPSVLSAPTSPIHLPELQTHHRCRAIPPPASSCASRRASWLVRMRARPQTILKPLNIPTSHGWRRSTRRGCGQSRSAPAPSALPIPNVSAIPISRGCRQFEAPN
jgi:hypothetical protein